MPSVKRDVHAFVTRLNPELVRKLDAYAIQSNLSRNQAVERLLERCFALTREVTALRGLVRSAAQDDPVPQQVDEIFAEQEEGVEVQRMLAAEKLSKRDLVPSAGKKSKKKK